MPTAKKTTDASDTEPTSETPTDPSVTPSDAETPQESEPVSEEQQREHDLAHEVLGGRYGDHHSARARLDNAGFDSSSVMAKVYQRLSQGAPSAYKLSPVGLLQQIEAGEWGPEKGLLQRLKGAGFSDLVVAEVKSHLPQSVTE